ncbi:hypothetical protein KZZ52_41040 [Dactylosporangium sp. AC04546]|uniref:hypothetical protein n=1 Tax=Dactylosporangium sp. AC04546 TaxID=2862460 RepID=UPI001EDF007A|nr:hypothetical protein [Dactylosporangium sp. AC04546]WVK80318.1 hypothetical protein KZZ52_41040 [Dactylosporangium sp. AC04546]
MLWLIAAAVVLLALVILVVVATKVGGTLRRFGIVAQSLQRRLLDGQQRVEPHLVRLQATVEALQPRLESMQDQALVLQARRGTDDNS